MRVPRFFSSISLEEPLEATLRVIPEAIDRRLPERDGEADNEGLTRRRDVIANDRLLQESECRSHGAGAAKCGPMPRRFFLSLETSIFRNTL